MIGLDANVVVRYIMQDDVKQSPMATRLIESRSAASPSFVPMVALVELVWVMSSAYELDKRQLIAALEGLLRTKEPVIEAGWIDVLFAGNARRKPGITTEDLDVKRLRRQFRIGTAGLSEVFPQRRLHRTELGNAAGDPTVDVP